MGIISKVKMKVLIVLFACFAGLFAADRLVNLANKDPHVLQALFSGFQRENDRHYSSPAEARLRLKNFRGFVKEMAAANDVDDGVEYGVTFFADLTEDEAQQYYGLKNGSSMADGEIQEAPKEDALQWGPSSSRNWKSKYNSAKQKSTCGSCWAFTTVGVVEGMAAIVKGGRWSFSEQEVLDCSGSSNNCRGGWYNEALNYIKSRNHLSGSSYRYQNRRGSCRYRNYSNALPFRITGVYQSRGDSGLATALNYGPVGVAVDWRNINIRGYWNGIWRDTNCNGWPTHAITAVGYTSSYWEIRNSWGSGWGNRGYFKLGRVKQNMCQIA